jgi:hypothetical protein
MKESFKNSLLKVLGRRNGCNQKPGGNIEVRIAK